jgi:hypothetical protein
MDLAWDLHGEYSTDIFTTEAVKLINEHRSDRPMFLYLAHTAVHSGNPYNPLPAPDEEVAKFDNIFDYKRRRFAGDQRCPTFRGIKYAINERKCETMT